MINMSTIYNYNSIHWSEQSAGFLDKISEILVSLNHTSEYSVVFVNILWNDVIYNISNGNQKEIWYNFFLFDIKNFLYYVEKEYKKFTHNFNQNNIDFSVMIFKNNWKRDEDYDEEDILLAA
jgi:hypothetical protein